MARVRDLTSPQKRSMHRLAQTGGVGIVPAVTADALIRRGMARMVPAGYLRLELTEMGKDWIADQL